MPTKNLNTAKRFNKKGNPILKITLPENSRYLDTDKLFNIDNDIYVITKSSDLIIKKFNRDNSLFEETYRGRSFAFAEILGMIAVVVNG